MRARPFLCALLLVAAAAACTSQEARIAEQRKAANEFFDNKEWSEAKVAYTNLLQLAPNDADAHYKMAETLWALQEYGAYVGDFSGSINLYADGSPEARAAWGDGLLTSSETSPIRFEDMRVIEWGELRSDG